MAERPIFFSDYTDAAVQVREPLRSKVIQIANRAIEFHENVATYHTNEAAKLKIQVATLQAGASAPAVAAACRSGSERHQAAHGSGVEDLRGAGQQTERAPANGAHAEEDRQAVEEVGQA